MSLATRLFLLQLCSVVILAGILAAVSYHNTAERMHREAASRVLSISATLANDPYVAASLADPAQATARLQPYTAELLEEANVHFVTIMTPDGTRLTHPDPEEIGRPYLGSIAQAASGRPQVEEYVGTLGPSVRAINPVFSAVARDGTPAAVAREAEVVGMVAVGVTSESLNVALSSDIPAIALVAGLALGLGGLSSWGMARYVRTSTLGLGPEQLHRLFAYHQSALHSLREGLLLSDPSGRLLLYNERAAQLLSLPPLDERDGVPATAQLPETVADLVGSARTAVDEIHLVEGRILILNQHPSSPGHRRPGEPGGVVTTVQDHTDLQSLTGELESMRTLADALRAQTHEHANRLHTVAALIELGRVQEALRFAVEDRQASQQLTDDVVRSLDEPYLSALLVGKAAQAHERGVQLTLSASGSLSSDSLEARDLVTITGNLLDNAFDAAASSEQRRVWADFAADKQEVIITIADSGPGIDEELIEEFLRFGASTKAMGGASSPMRGVGLALVRQSVHRLGGTFTIENDGGAIFTVVLPRHAPTFQEDS